MVRGSPPRRDLPVTGVRRTAITALALALFLLLPGTARAASQNVVCKTAALLIQQGKPQQAEAKIKAASLIRECAVELAAARDQRTLAETVAEKAQAELALNRWAEASTWAASALALDTDNELAKAVAASAKKASAAEAAQQAALAAADKSQLQKLLDQWNSFFERQVAPLGSLLLPFLGILTVLLVISRLLVMAVPRWRPADDEQPRAQRGRIIGGGVAALVASSALLSVGLAGAVGGPLPVGAATVAFLLAFVAGMVSFVVGERAARTAVDASGDFGPAGRRRRWPSPPLLAALGAGLAVFASVGMVVRLVGGDEASAWLAGWAVIGLGLAAAGLGVLLTAWWLATRLRLNITFADAAGADKKTSAALVAAYLNELGAEPPKGLEVPRGTDVTALDGAFATLPDNAVLKAVKSFISDLAGVTPWTAAIDAGDRSVAVTVRRNARATASAIIDPKALRLTKDTATPSASTAASAEASTDDKTSEPDGTEDTLRMAAAFVLAAMATEHPSIRRGLAGTTDWKSLGYHYIASTLPSGKDTKDRTTELLASALNEDPENRLARLAFRHGVDREATDSDTLIAYAGFLAETRTELQDHESEFDIDSLVLRVMYVRALVLVNAVYAHHFEAVAGLRTPDAVKEGELKELAKTALRQLDAVTADPGSSTDGDELRHFRSQFRDDIQGVKYLVGLSDVRPSVVTPIGMYNLGATYASRNDVTWPSAVPARGSDDAEAVKLFARACKDPLNRQWIEDDPQLVGFRERTAYQNEFLADPRTDFFELSPVKPYAARLKGAGFGEVGLLARTLPHFLEGVTSADRSLCQSMIDLARLRMSLNRKDDTGSRPLDGWAIEILDQLTTRGLATASALQALQQEERETLADKVATKVLERCKPGKDKKAADVKPVLTEEIRNWSTNP